MKKKIILSAFILILSFFTNIATAQSDETRNQIQVTINFEGKVINTELRTFSISASRDNDSDPKKQKKEETRFYLYFELKKNDTEFLRIFSKKQTKVDGTVVLADNYGKNLPRIIGFSKASLTTYNDQLNSSSYNESSGLISIALICSELIVDGIQIE
ncbi:hypothetical protein ACHRVZ_11520 [Flavobacterium sp. FlaQc-57]|uniref:hypothetical protein n=1 Tax=Flavobacterium sp. FlaQc-57 TaxID=3374186 RepID=UPI003757165C